MKHEDDLMDALLKEQAKGGADEKLLASIEEALDEKKSGGGGWRRGAPWAAAAAIMIGGWVVYHSQPEEEPVIAYHPTSAPVESRRVMEAPELADAKMQPSVPSEPVVADENPLTGLFVEPATAPPHGAAPQTKGNLDGFAQDEPSSRPLPRIVAPPAGEGQTRRLDDLRGMPGDVGGAGFEPNLALLPPVEERLRSRGSEWFPVPGRSLPKEKLLQGADAEEFSRDNYGQLVDQPWKSPWDDPLSTFSIDVDTASYTNVRRAILEGRAIQPDAVRIEECINYFDYRYEPPSEGNAFAVHTKLATCPWQPEHLLARVAIKGKEIAANARPASNLVFLIDVSGSMQSSDKLPLLKQSMQVLIDSLDERDRVGIVVYAGTEGVVLEPTLLDEAGKSKAAAALTKLESGGSTNGGAGLARAYQMADSHRVDDGVNRVILATDGDFNVGTTGQGQLVELVKKQAAKGVSLSVLGFGTGNLNDAMMEAITNDGNGNYFYVDGQREAERIFLQKLSGTLVTIAKDVKIQVEFNPGKVKAYRLIGYANRVLRNQDFNDDKVDAGDIGAGHTVTAFYEIVPVGVDGPDTGGVDGLRYQQPAERKELVESDDWFTLKLRYKYPEGEKSRLIESPVTGDPVKWEDAGNDFRMASAVALFGMKLRGQVEEVPWDRVAEIARPALADDPEERRAEFFELIKKLD
ncbi:vWA domain-containing protein [Haloferula sargassicola]|uniref:VWFA domain-containing protein n=1 Tax=Haloferula sargassicola TaxID=490096 RepID=A0ABP9UT80_9BACT